MHSPRNINVDANHDNSDNKFGDLTIQCDIARVDWESEDCNGSKSDIDFDENVTDSDDLECKGNPMR